MTSGSVAFDASRNFAVSSGTATLDTRGNTDTVNGALTGAGVLAKSGTGTLNLSGSVGIAGLNANSGVTQLAQSGSIGAISIAAGATLSMAAHTGSTCNVLDTSSLVFSGTTGKIDLWNNAMIVRAADAGANAVNLAAIQTKLNAGANNLTWTGEGITSTTAFNESGNTGVLTIMAYDNTGLLFDTFEGVSGLGSYDLDSNPIGFNQVLLKLTYLGDLSGDGTVDGTDYTLMDYYFQTQNMLGDTNGDGVVDGTDYTLLDYGFQTQNFGVLAGAATSGSAGTGAAAASPEAVPEPGTLGFMLASALGLLGSRRKGNRISRGI